MSEEQQAATEGNSVREEDRRPSQESQVCQIRIKGHLDDSWCAWFDKWTMSHEQDGTTVLTGPVADQPALHGVLARIGDLGLPLISIKPVGIE